MTRKMLRALIVVLLTAVAVVGLQPVPAQAAPVWTFMATTGATQVEVGDATISSDITAQSTLTGSGPDLSTSNSTAGVDVAQAVKVGAVTSEAVSFATPTGFATRTTTRTAGANLLGGLITADVIETTVTTYADNNGTSRAEGGTRYVGLKIAGINLPVDIPHNHFVTIPGIAAVSLNYFLTVEDAGNRGTLASAVSIRLLDGVGLLSPGARVTINPSMTLLAAAPPPQAGAKLGGFAYGTRVLADAARTVSVTSGPTAMFTTPVGGSHGETRTNATASVNIPGVLRVGAVRSTSTSQSLESGDGWVTNTNEVASIDALGGLVTADAVKVTAHGEKVDGVYRSELDLTFVNLVVAGQPIDIDVAPNTEIQLAGLGTLIVNEQVVIGTANRVRALYLVLDTEALGLPVGASVEIATAATSIQ